MKNLEIYNAEVLQPHQGFAPLEKLIENNLTEIEVIYNNQGNPTNSDWDIRVNNNNGFMGWGSYFPQVSITNKISGRRGTCTIYKGKLACVHYFN
jgi:hypothetical protein